MPTKITLTTLITLITIKYFAHHQSNHDTTTIINLSRILHEEQVSFSHSVHVNFSCSWRFWWSSITRTLNSHSSSYEKCSNNRGWNTYKITT